MKRLIQFMAIAVASIAFIACTGKSKQNEKTAETTKDTLNWSGTYEGVVSMPNSPESQRYILLALNGDGRYEMFQKQIGHITTYSSKGKLVWNNSNDSLKLTSDKEFHFQVSGNTLKYGTTILKRISREKSLDDVYCSHIVKHNKSGNNYTVRIYSEGDTEYAEFEFEGKKYKLKSNLEDSQEQKFTDGSVYLVWNIVDPAPLANYNPIFYDGKNIHKFSVLSPSNTIYKTKENNAKAKILDVLYFNNETGKSFVKIMSSEYCYILKQTEASSKTASYENDTVKLFLNNQRGATLVIGENKHEYSEENAF